MKKLTLTMNLLNDFIDEKFEPIIIDLKTTLNATQCKYLFLPYVERNFFNYNNEADELDAFNFLWLCFISEYLPKYKKAYETLQLEYNPLDNYNGVTEFIHGKTKVKTTNDIASKKVTDTMTDTPSGYNSSTYSNRDKTIDTSVADAYQDTITTDGDSYTDVEKKHGNLGVTTSQQMINSQIELDTYSLNKWYIDLFANQNLFY